MNENEALKILQRDLQIQIENKTLPDGIEAVKIAIDALEKQTPKKPIPIDYEKYMDATINARFLRGAFWCPNCKHVVKSGSFCSDCGQSLDWSEEESE